MARHVLLCLLACFSVLHGEESVPVAVGSFRAWPDETPAVEQEEGGAESPAALWETFTTRLRAGRTREAHLCFSPSSRQAFSFAAFAAHYHPLTAVHEATLSPVDEGRFLLRGETASLRFAAAGGRAGLLVTALFVRDGGRWWLVAAAREEIELAEAEARDLLRRLDANSIVAEARKTGRALGEASLRAGDPAAFRRTGAELQLRRYEFRLDASGCLVAAARHADFRSFRLLAGADPVVDPALLPTAAVPELGPESAP